MAVYPGANYRPLNQFSNIGSRPRLGVVLHVNESDGPSLYNWIAGNHGMSCHFQVAKDGTVEQYIDTDNGSWCQVNGNDTYLSIETQGFHTEALTDAQVHAIALLMSWVHATHAIPLQLAEQPGQPGLIWHGAGGNSWGGHFDCPGEPRKTQRVQILALAGGTVPSTDWFDMATPADLEASLRKVLNEGTGAGQQNWAGTNKAILAGVQTEFNEENKTQAAITALAAKIPSVDAFIAGVHAELAKVPPAAGGGVTPAQVEAAVRNVLHNA